MIADVGIIFARAIITLIMFEFDHLRTLGPDQEPSKSSSRSVVVASGRHKTSELS